MATRRSISPLSLSLTLVASVAFGLICNHWARVTLDAIDGGTIMTEAGTLGARLCIPDLLLHPLSFELSQVGLSSALVGALVPWLTFYWGIRETGNYRPGEEHGSARWLSQREMRAFGDWDDLDNNIILSRRGRMVLKASSFNLDRDRNKNVLVIGGPGSGKTRYVIKPNLMQLNSNVWVSDPKGMLPVEVGQMYLEAGYDLRVFNTIDFGLSMHFNPFAYIHGAADIPPLVDCIVSNVKPPKSNGSASDPFWEQSEKQLITALTAYMYEALEPPLRTFRTLTTLLSMIEVDENSGAKPSPLDVLFDAWELGKAPMAGAGRQARLSDNQRDLLRPGTPHPNSYAVTEYKKFKVGAGKTLKSILMSVNADLWQFDLPEVLELTDYDEMDLDSLGGLVEEDLVRRAQSDPGILEPGKGTPCGRTKSAPNGQRKTALFVAMDDQNSTYNFLIAVLTYLGISRLKNYADTHGGSLPIPVQFYLDEFANIGKIADFEKVITTIRSRNMAVTLVIQSLSQLDSVYGEKEAGIIKDACASWLYIGGCGGETCKTLSDKIGNQTVNNRSTSKTYAEKNSAGVSEQILQRPLIDAAEVGKLSPWKCLVLITGRDAFMDDKYLVEEHPRYLLIDPGHHKGKSRHGIRYPDAKFDSGLDVRAWRLRVSGQRAWERHATADAIEISGEARREMLAALLERRSDVEVEAFLRQL